MKPELLAIFIAVTCIITMLIGMLLEKLISNSKLEELTEEHENKLSKIHKKNEERVNVYENTIKEFQRKNVNLKDKVSLLQIQLSEKEKTILELERDMSKELTADLLKTVIENIKK